MLVSRVGAYLVGMGFIQSTPGAPAGKKMKLLLNVNGSIYVDKRGNRIVNEGERRARHAGTLRLHGLRQHELHELRRVEAPLSEDRGFTLTVRQLFQGAKPPKRHRLYKVCAADLFPVPPCSRNSAS